MVHDRMTVWFASSVPAAMREQLEQMLCHLIISGDIPLSENYGISLISMEGTVQECIARPLDELELSDFLKGRPSAITSRPLPRYEIGDLRRKMRNNEINRRGSQITASLPSRHGNS